MRFIRLIIQSIVPIALLVFPMHPGLAQEALPPQPIVGPENPDSLQDSTGSPIPEFPQVPDTGNASGNLDSTQLPIPAAADTAVPQEPDTTAPSGDTATRTQPDTTATSQVPPPQVHPAEARPRWLYPGMTVEQHQLAMEMLSSLYAYRWSNADKIGRRMQKLEKKKNLPPLSYLLLVGMDVMRIQRGEYESSGEKKDLLAEIDKLSSKGVELASSDKDPDPNYPTDLFIFGGIKGFQSTLDIDRSPISAAMSGFSAVKSLQKTLASDSTLSDAWLGLGLFNCILSKASFIVRSALSIIGKSVSYPRGLTQLRKCAYHGYYASDIAKLYLVEFLSPYMGDQAKEKQAILWSLEKSYPQNPYFLFLDLDENLCFHGKMLSSITYRDRIRRQISKIKPENQSTRRYANLLKWQYLMIDPFPSAGLYPDTTMDLGDFAYYPVFLKALREKNSYDNNSVESKSERARHLKLIRSLRDQAADLLNDAPNMPASMKSYYLWHIRDALRVRSE